MQQSLGLNTGPWEWSLSAGGGIPGRSVWIHKWEHEWGKLAFLNAASASNVTRDNASERPTEQLPMAAAREGSQWAAVNSTQYNVQSTSPPRPPSLWFHLYSLSLSVFHKKKGFLPSCPSPRAKKCLCGKQARDGHASCCSYVFITILLLAQRTESESLHWCPVIWACSKLTYGPMFWTKKATWWSWSAEVILPSFD